MNISNVNIPQNIEESVIAVQKCLDHASLGAIYVRIGTHLPSEIQYELIEVFRSLRQQIIWEFNDDDTNNNQMPDNVMICPTLPTKFVLSHKNIMLFVTEDETLAIKQALHYGVPMMLIPFRNSELHGIVKKTALENMTTIRVDEVKKEILLKKLEKMLENKDLKAHAKEIATLLHHNSVNLSSDLMKSNDSTKSPLKSRDLSQSHVHLDALGALFFVIFVVVKVSLTFCRFYNSWDWKTSATSKKTKL